MDRLLPPGSAGVRYGAERGAQERLIRVISATWAPLLGHRCLDTRHMQNIHTHPYKARLVHDIFISNLIWGCLRFTNVFWKLCQSYILYCFFRTSNFSCGTITSNKCVSLNIIWFLNCEEALLSKSAKIMILWPAPAMPTHKKLHSCSSVDTAVIELWTMIKPPRNCSDLPLWRQ